MAFGLSQLWVAGGYMEEHPQSETRRRLHRRILIGYLLGFGATPAWMFSMPLLFMNRFDRTRFWSSFYLWDETAFRVAVWVLVIFFIGCSLYGFFYAIFADRTLRNMVD